MFAGFTVFLAVLALAFRELLVLVVAVPFAAATYAFWYHATGRLAARVRREQARGDAREQRRADATGRGGFGAGPREPWERPGGERLGGERRRDARGRRQGQQRRAPGADSGPSAAEAYRVLGVDEGADEEAVRRAYRERVKEAHPDTESGSEEEFKRVRSAYERLTD